MNMSSEGKALLNALSVIVVIGVNFLSQLEIINGQTVGELSDQYANLFTPSGYAFSIWGVIFIGMIAFAGFQLREAFSTTEPVDHIEQVGYGFAVANFLNATWLVTWLMEWTGLSVVVMLFLLLSLLRVILRTNMERWHAPFRIIAFVWWPICIYAGWISVATIANAAAFLVKIGWNGEPLSEETWTIIMIAVATVLNLLMIATRNMREFALVGVWALAAIYHRHAGSMDSIAYTALAGAIILGIAISIHAYQNRKSHPLWPKSMT